MEKKAKAIVRVYRPELTPEEYERRLAKLKKSAAELLIAIEKEKARREI